MFALHSLTGCDSVATTYVIGNAKAVKVSSQDKVSHICQLGQTTADLTDVVKRYTDFMATVGTENWKVNCTKNVWLAINK
jgi:hypothetical protein